MVKLTTKYLFWRASKKNQVEPRKKDETELDYLNRITHLYLQSQFIDKIAPMPECQSVTVIYLQNNLLQSIHNVDKFPKLTHLYLQHNYISKLENLAGLTSLKKLYLGWNEVSVVEGLENLKNLTELHLENQRLPQGETLYFDPRTIWHLGNSLKVLNITNNNVSSIASLGGLNSLKKLIVERNRIENLDDFAETLSYLPSLEELSSEGNPVTSARKYMDAVIMAAKGLKVLNGKPVDDRTRLFIANLFNQRECRRRLQERSAQKSESEEIFSYHCGDFFGGRGIGVPSLPSPQIGSKLFPVMRELAKDGSGKVKLFPEASAKSLSPVFQNSVKVSRPLNSMSFYY